MIYVFSESAIRRGDVPMKPAFRDFLLEQPLSENNPVFQRLATFHTFLPILNFGHALCHNLNVNLQEGINSKGVITGFQLQLNSIEEWLSFSVWSYWGGITIGKLTFVDACKKLVDHFKPFAFRPKIAVHGFSKPVRWQSLNICGDEVFSCLVSVDKTSKLGSVLLRWRKYYWLLVVGVNLMWPSWRWHHGSACLNFPRHENIVSTTN